MNKDEMLKIGWKILGGRRLTKEEFTASVRHGYLHPKGAPKDVSEDDLWESWDKTYYEDEKVRGYLCVKDGKIQSRVKEKNADGSETICIWGLHREDVNPEKLRPEQRGLW